MTYLDTPYSTYRPDIYSDQLAFIREALSHIGTYAATRYGTPPADERLLLIASAADTVSDLAFAWDWGGYDNVEVSQGCFETLRDLEEHSPELISPLLPLLKSVIERLKHAQSEGR